MDRDIDDIFDHLAYIASQKRTLKLITNFRGVPIHLAADIIRCSRAMETVRLRVYHRQIVSVNKASKILVQSDLFPNILVCDVKYIDLHTAIIILGNLRYVTGSMGNRKNVRVQPENPIHVEVIARHGYRVQGEMIDISLDGLSLSLKKDQIPHNDMFNLHTPVEIRLGLPIYEHLTGETAIYDIRVQAKIAYKNENQQTYRIGLLAILDEPDLGILRRYIFDRQTEILKEIQQMNGALLEAV